MNNWAKVTIGLGVVFLLVGAVMTALGGAGAGTAIDWDPEENAVWMATDGVYSHGSHEDNSLIVMVRDDVACDEFTLTIVLEDGSESDVKYVADDCTEDGVLPQGHADDPDGWHHLGWIYNLENETAYFIDASHESALVLPEELFGEIFGNFLGALGGIFGGASCLCCGVIFLVLGIILAFAIKDPKKQTQIQFAPIATDTPSDSEVGGESNTPPLEKSWYEE